MKIIDKRKHYEYDTDYNEEELLKLSKLILEFLESLDSCNIITKEVNIQNLTLINKLL